MIFNNDILDANGQPANASLQAREQAKAAQDAIAVRLRENFKAHFGRDMREDADATHPSDIDKHVFHKIHPNGDWTFHTIDDVPILKVHFHEDRIELFND